MKTSLTIQELISLFNNNSQWEQRYKLLIQLSNQLERLPDAKKTEEFLLAGCESNLWIDIHLTEEGNIEVNADSDSKILRGILYVITLYCSELTIKKSQNIDFKQLFEQIGVLHKLSTNRKKGILTIEEKIKAIIKTNL